MRRFDDAPNSDRSKICISLNEPFQLNPHSYQCTVHTYVRTQSPEMNECT